MSTTQIHHKHLIRKNRLFFITLFVCSLLGLSFTFLQWMTGDLTSYIAPIAIGFAVVISMISYVLNDRNQLIHWLPTIGFFTMTLLSGFILYGAKRVTTELILFVFLAIVSIYMRKTFLIGSFLIGLIMQHVFLQHMSIHQPIDVVLHTLFYTLLFLILFSIKRNNHDLIQDLFSLQVETESLHELLKERHQKLQEMDQLKDQFLANISHELKTPIHGIMGLSEAMTEGAFGTLPKEVVDSAKLIHGAGHRLHELVQDLLDFSLLQSQKLALQKDLICLNDPISIAVQTVRNECLEKNIAVSYSLLTHSPIWASVDPRRFHRLLQHVFKNAVKYTENGEIECMVDIIHQELVIQIKDTGIGMSKEQLKQIMFPFSKTESSTRRHVGGVGMGLALSRLIAELHGGRLEVTSELHKGTTVTIRLPVL